MARTATSLGMLAVALGSAAGCASEKPGPELLIVSSHDYAATFDAAVEAARMDGMPSALRDRRGGVIETLPRVAGSFLEPWRLDNASMGQALENTVAYQRRRARFEFVPAGFVPPDAVQTTQPLTGADVVNAEQAPMDLTTIQGDLELRVWVYLERASVPGQRRSTWTRSKTTQAQLVYPEGMGERRGTSITWSPATRDSDYERRLLSQVQKLLGDRSGSPLETKPLAHNSEPLTAVAE